MTTSQPVAAIPAALALPTGPDAIAPSCGHGAFDSRCESCVDAWIEDRIAAYQNTGAYGYGAASAAAAHDYYDMTHPGWQRGVRYDDERDEAEEAYWRNYRDE